MSGTLSQSATYFGVERLDPKPLQDARPPAIQRLGVKPFHLT